MIVLTVSSGLAGIEDFMFYARSRPYAQPLGPRVTLLCRIFVCTPWWYGTDAVVCTCGQAEIGRSFKRLWFQEEYHRSVTYYWTS